MNIIINDERKISDVQNEFNQIFPYLKIEFYAKSLQSHGASSNLIIQDSTQNLGECRIINHPGNLIIAKEMTVRELVQFFSVVYDLTIKISRKSGKTWLETTVTDVWTLEEQNNQGEMLSK